MIFKNGFNKSTQYLTAKYKRVKPVPSSQEMFVLLIGADAKPFHEKYHNDIQPTGVWYMKNMKNYFKFNAQTDKYRCMVHISSQGTGMSYSL